MDQGGINTSKLEMYIVVCEFLALPALKPLIVLLVHCKFQNKIVIVILVRFNEISMCAPEWHCSSRCAINKQKDWETQNMKNPEAHGEEA